MIHLAKNQSIDSRRVYKYDSADRQGLYTRIAQLERENMLLKRYGQVTIQECELFELKKQQESIRQAHEFFESIGS